MLALGDRKVKVAVVTKWLHCMAQSAFRAEKRKKHARTLRERRAPKVKRKMAAIFNNLLCYRRYPGK